MAQAPDQPPESVIYNQFAGLRNTVTAERLASSELEKAVNIDLDDVGQAHRRRGRAKVADGAFHSIWKTATYTLGVRDGMLGIINPNYSFIELTSVGLDHIAYVQVGDDVYFSSRSTSGVVRSNWQVDPWGTNTPENTWLSPVVNPTPTLGEIGGKLLGPPPLATALEYLNGRIYLASERDLWATELYLYNYVDKTRTFIRFEDDITVVGAVTDGLYVGTKSAVWFLSGPFGQMQRIPVIGYGALPGSVVKVPAELVHPQGIQQDVPSKNAVLFLTQSGLVAGFDNGTCYNLTQDKVLFPDAGNAAALFRRQDGVNSYVAVADSGGTPSSNARIGDYVDAEIRRFQGV